MQMTSNRRRAFRLPNSKITKLHNSSRGYILITLMLFMTLLTMAALAMLPDIVQQIQRDREEEMIHRGTEYMRAIKKYYKKFGRYPARIEELENTNQIRFLRKRYKDPLAKGDHEFKLVHVGDPSLAALGVGNIGLTPGAGPGVLPGGNPGLAQGGPGFVGAQGGGVRQAGPNDANAPQVTGLPGQQQAAGAATPPPGDATNADASVDAKSAAASDDTGSSGQQVFGGGPILGVVSTSKAKTIREFNKKNHYNDWLFVYDPRADRGGILKGPIQANSAGSGGINQTGTQPPTQGGPSGTPQPGPAGPPGQQEPPDEQ
jgi:type II secretory pathway pseudopilin PulG